MDQIFPHELGHVFIRQLIGELGDGGGNQIHSTALRTDRIVAFNEGFAEHFQIMTLDSPQAPPETARLSRDEAARTRAAAGWQVLAKHQSSSAMRVAAAWTAASLPAAISIQTWV